MSSSPAAAVLRAARFDSLGLPPEFVRILNRRGISETLPIQALCIPDALAGRDVSGKAPTGSGKTLAFSLPMAARLAKGRSKRPTGLVLAPTRELAAQIAAELSPLAAARGLRVHAFYGGVGYSPQLKALRTGIDIAVACPGRLEDLMAGGHVVLDEVACVVVDEADRMADMGFLPAVRRILDLTRTDRQTLLFSATLDGDVDVLVRRYQRNPVRHEVDSEEDVSQMSHRFHYVAHDERVATCAKIIADTGTSIVFVRTRHGADRLVRQLGKLGVVAAAIHGDRSQAQRERALQSFSSGSVRALVATDVAARGIHVDDVACVIHFDLSEEPKDYVHRSGRTARAGAAGVSIALVSHEQHGAAEKLRVALDLSPEMVGDVPAPSRQRTPSAAPGRPQHSNRGGQGRRRRGAPTRSRARS
ncbi:MAG TPA: DEAD/DEAH box helicase [Acidimicrobiales bacterium]|nr:DEAD/DEAH box helicase [Acidimicrobiales bacterium]